MPGLKDVKDKINGVKKTAQITKAMNMVASAKLRGAQEKMERFRPYAGKFAEAMRDLSGGIDSGDLPLMEVRDVRKVEIVVVTSDRGLCGSFNANVLRRAEELFSLLRDQGKTPVLYVVGRKALGYYSFRQRTVTESWTGFSERPEYVNAKEIADTLVASFLAGADDEGDEAGADGVLGVDELHIVFTEFKSMLSQTAEARRIAPMVVEYVGEQEAGPHTLFSFEPDPDTLFEALLPRYVATRVYAALLEAAASESASRRRAMKSASDNADDLIKALTLMANRERQAQITQEISEIVGGANALADAK